MKSNEENPYLNPYLAGFLLGLTLLASFVILGKGVGVIDGLARISSWCVLQVAPQQVIDSEYFGAWGSDPLKFYLVFMVTGIFIGGFVSAVTSRRVQVQTERGASFSVGKRLLLATFGGLIVGFAGHFGKECFLGGGLSGAALLTTGSFAFLISTLAGGYLAAWFFRGQWHD